VSPLPGGGLVRVQVPVQVPTTDAASDVAALDITAADAGAPVVSDWVGEGADCEHAVKLTTAATESIATAG
jgi:hypothetical protein